MNLFKAAMLVALAMVFPLQAVFANPIIENDNVKPEKVFVIFRGSDRTTPHFESFRRSFKDQFGKEGIKAAFHVANKNNMGNQIFKLALDAGADYIILVDQTQQHLIDGKTNIGSGFTVKYFSLNKDYVWKSVSDDLKMNVEVARSIENGNKQILASFLTKVEYDNSQLAKN